jgi:hypothetical protein
MGGEQFLELTGVKPDAMTIGARVQHNRTINAAVNPQQIRAIARAFPSFPVRLLILAATSKRRHVPGIFGQ